MIDKQVIKDNLERILTAYGAVKLNSSSNWTCIPSRHENPKNNLSVKKNICCCHCGIKGDSLNVIAEMENLNIHDKKDFLLIVKKACEILSLNNIDMNMTTGSKRLVQKTSSHISMKKVSINLNYIISHRNNSNYMYFIKRGFNKKLIDKYNIIVKNPKKIFYDEILPKLNNSWAYEYIIPIYKDGNIVNCILRRNDWKSKDNCKTLNLKNLSIEFLNNDYLKDEQKYLFICEGWADALSFEQIGVKAIAINSTAMINKLSKDIELNIHNLKNTTFFICFDNDKAGQTASKQLKEQLKRNSLKVFNLKIKYKDVNDYFVKDRNTFIKNTRNLLSML